MKNRAVNIFLSTILTFLLVFPLVPELGATSAYAQTGIYTGTGILGEGSNSPSAKVVNYGGRSWYVVGYDGTGSASAQGEMVLFMKGTETLAPYRENLTGDLAYKGCKLQTTIDNFVNDNFSAEEQEAVIPKTLNGMNIDQYDVDWWLDNFETVDDVPDEGVTVLAWPLSANEARTVNQELRKAEYAYWLRSYGCHGYTDYDYEYDDVMAIVTGDGVIDIQPDDENVTYWKGVRPAFKMKMDSVLMTTLTSTGEYKLTLKDAARKNFSVNGCKNSLNSNGDLVIEYQNAVPGDNEYISYVIKGSDGSIKNYKSCDKVASASGTATLTGLPKDASGKISLGEGDKLCVFNEQINDDKRSNIASEFIEVSPDTLGHDWSEISYEWAADDSTVTAARVCNNDESHNETETVETVALVTKEATCTEKGETTYTATFENDAFEDQSKTVANIDALGHDWGEWMQSKAPTCSSKGEDERICNHDSSHRETRETGRAPNTHSWKFVKFTWTGSETDGYTEAMASYVCEHNADHTTTAEAVVTEKVTKPTCTTPGKTTYTATVSAVNSPDRLEHKASKDAKATSTTGHAWDNPTYTWSKDNSSVTATRVCKNDPAHKETETVKTTKVTKVATYTAAGSITYTATFKNSAFKKQTKTETIPKLEAKVKIGGITAAKHEIGKVTYQWAKKAGTTGTWTIQYRTRKIGGNNSWSKWTTKTFKAGTLQTAINVPPNYCIEVRGKGSGDSAWSKSIFTTPAGGKYQSMKYVHVKNVATNKRVTSITLRKGQTVKLRPDYDYPVKNYTQRPRLYPNHMFYDDADASIISIRNDRLGKAYNGTMVDGTVTIKGLKAGTTTITCRAPNGRTMKLRVTVK